LDVKQLKSFVTVVDMKSFSRAAKHLFVSQSMLSRVVKNLEQEYGVQLIYFDGNQMRLTHHGTQLYAMAQNLIRQHDAINEAMHGAVFQEKGVIRVGLSRIGGPSVFPDLAASFLKKYPSIEFAVEQRPWLQELEKMVATQELDVGFVLPPVLTNVFETMSVHKSSFVIVAHRNNPLAERETLHFSDLADQQFVMIGPEFRIHQEFLAGCRMAGFEPRIMANVVYPDLIFEFVKREMGITFIVQDRFDKFANDDLVSIPVVDAISQWEVVMITAKNRYESTPLRLFTDHVKEMVDAGVGKARS